MLYGMQAALGDRLLDRKQNLREYMLFGDVVTAIKYFARRRTEITGERAISRLMFDRRVSARQLAYIDPKEAPKKLLNSAGETFNDFWKRVQADNRLEDDVKERDPRLWPANSPQERAYRSYLKGLSFQELGAVLRQQIVLKGNDPWRWVDDLPADDEALVQDFIDAISMEPLWRLHLRTYLLRRVQNVEVPRAGVFEYKTIIWEIVRRCSDPSEEPNKKT
jgi:hypothetical protein